MSSFAACPAAGDVSVCKIDQPAVGDRNPMRVPGQIVRDVLGTAEWSLGICHLVFAKKGLSYVEFGRIDTLGAGEPRDGRPCF